MLRRGPPGPLGACHEGFNEGPWGLATGVQRGGCHEGVNEGPLDSPRELSAHAGDTRYPSFPASFSSFERELHRSPPPTLGQHNREILQGELGIGDKDFERLEEEGIIGTRPSFM